MQTFKQIVEDWDGQRARWADTNTVEEGEKKAALYHTYEDPDQRLEGHRIVCFLQAFLDALKARDHIHPFASSQRAFLKGFNNAATKFPVVV
jgi:hypothetical protein